MASPFDFGAARRYDDGRAGPYPLLALNGYAILFAIVETDALVDVAETVAALEPHLSRIVGQFGLELSQLLGGDANSIILHLEQNLAVVPRPGAHDDRTAVALVFDAVIQCVFDKRLQDSFKTE